MEMQERTVIGGDDRFATVRHPTVHGTNFAIGRAVGAIAIQRYGRVVDQFATDPVYGRARWTYDQRSFPVHAEPVRGVVEGINSTGLAVALLADEEAMAQLGPLREVHPDARAVGLHELVGNLMANIVHSAAAL